MVAPKVGTKMHRTRIDAIDLETTIYEGVPCFTVHATMNFGDGDFENSQYTHEISWDAATDDVLEEAADKLYQEPDYGDAEVYLAWADDYRKRN
jgi:hypothetical protein